jgi:hypothetical protein
MDCRSFAIAIMCPTNVDMIPPGALLGDRGPIEAPYTHGHKELSCNFIKLVIIIIRELTIIILC